MDGSTFLALYGVLFFTACAGAWFVRRHFRVPDDDVRDGELHPYEHAYLQGGEARAIAASIAALHERGTLIVNSNREPSTVAVTTSTPSALDHPLDAAVIRTLDTPAPLSLDRELALRLRALPELATIRERLERRALLLDATAAWPARFVPAAVMFAFTGVGAARIFHGVLNDKPVAFTVVLAMIGVATAVYFASQRVIRSVRGDLVLARIAGTFREQRAADTSADASSDERVERVARLVAIDGPSAVPGLAVVLGVLALGTGFNVDGDGGGGGGDGGGCGGCGGCE